MNRKVIGMYLKQLREQKKLTQEQLASIFSEEYGISISVHAISEWENGNTLPSGENLEILAEIYDKTLDELLDGKDRVDVDYDDIYTIGDNINDYRMVKEYHGYTLPWAKKSLIDVCEGVVPSVRTLIKRIER